MRNHPRTTQAAIGILAVLLLIACTGCASLTSSVARDATPGAMDRDTPEHIESTTDPGIPKATAGWTSEGTEEREPAHLTAAIAPVNAYYEGHLIRRLSSLAQGRGTMFYALGVLAVLGGAALVGRALWTLGRKRNYEREIARHHEALEAAMRVLWSEGVRLHSAQRYPTSNGDLTAADAELVQSTVRRLVGARPSDPRQDANCPLPVQQEKTLLRYGS